MNATSILVTGANRGIGLGLVKQFLAAPGVQHIFATARNPDAATELKAIQDSRLHVLKMDVDDDTSIQDAFKQTSSIIGDKGLDILVNNAGIWVDYFSDKGMDRNVFNKQLNTNCTSPLIMTQTFLPLLEKGSGGRVANISSGLGSIALNNNGSYERGALAYRASKAALNMVAKTMSIDLAPKNIVITNFCPGWVQTEMGGEGAVLTIDDSTKSLANSIMKINKEHTGGFYQRDLKPLPF